MVSLKDIQYSNSRIRSTLPAGLVAVFVGATSGVGETTLREFARHAVAPRVYFLGRSQSAGSRIAAECKKLNPNGTFTFIQSDLSLIRNVDNVCRDLKAKERHINLLWLSQGALIQGVKTDEGLNYLMALMHFSRIRFILNLLPLLQAAPGLKRVVSCLAGTKEGPMMLDDFQGFKVPANKVHSARGHAASIQTLCMEHIAKQAPDVSFIHNFPGFVKSQIGRGSGMAMFTLRMMFMVMMPLAAMDTREAGERHVFFLTTGRFPALSGSSDGAGVPVEGAIAVAKGSNTAIGNGVYTIDEHADSGDKSVDDLLARLRGEDGVAWVWKKTEDELLRITNTASI